MSTGAVLGREADKSCALIIHVRRGDLIGVREKLMLTEEYQWRYFRIGSHFHPVPLDLPSRCISQQECIALLTIFETEELDQIDFSDDGLRKFFAQRHPMWLQNIAYRQLRHWKRNKPDKFFRLAPAEVAAKDIPRCVKSSPYAALARFQDRLDKDQLSHCIRRCPRAGVMFALDKIPPRERERHLVDHPKEALQFAAHLLSDVELALCARLEMFTAFRCRSKMLPERHAILLAHSYLVALSEMKGRSMDGLHNEIRDSIIGFPKQWRNSDPGGFPSIISGLSEYLNTGLDPVSMTALLEKAEPEDQQILANLIAAQI